MSTIRRRKAEHLARQSSQAAPPVTANDPNPAVAVGAELLLINQAIITHRIRNDTHANLDQYEARVRASDELQAALLADTEYWVRELVRVWHDIACASIKAGDVTLGLTQLSVGTTVTHDRLYLLVRELTAERLARRDTRSETASPEGLTD